MKKLTSVALVAVAILATPVLTLAWDAAGHRTVAMIAWDQMTPQARARAVALLMHGPLLANFASLRPSEGPDAERDRGLFVNAATWADLVRNANEAWHAYNRPAWHYADFYWDVENGVAHNLPGTGPDTVNAGERIEAFRAQIADPSIPDTTKAVDLAWLLHLVGDIHQPLHCSSRVTARDPLPDGDRGGNGFLLDDHHKLHLYWDDILEEAIAPESDEDSLAYAARMAHRIEKAHPAAGAPSADVAGWERECLHLAQTVVYDSLKRGAAPSDAYRAKALKVSEKQMALAGRRLAALLNTALK
ncbi:MAG TPA: S1/P1 nuclease [Gemmatimonadales bacterium]|nr:S1/P1 nuclease [Gemmatimonadales bacterium]